jgi:hypothetical protein
MHVRCSGQSPLKARGFAREEFAGGFQDAIAIFDCATGTASD